eukprot:m.148495 g.148495  ORF g.148495 m.148495 type:complete len:101 (+) comp20601_c0_seq4:82-384(+)
MRSFVGMRARTPRVPCISYPAYQQATKDYVQHHVKREAAVVGDLLEKGAHFYICGDAKHMAHDVQEALVDVLTVDGNRQAAQEKLKQMSTKKRIQLDVWS